MFSEFTKLFFVVQIGVEPTSPEGTGFTDRRANQLLNYTNKEDRGNYDIPTLTLTGFCSASELPILIASTSPA